MELREIIDSVREGEVLEFAHLVSRYRDMAFGYAMTLLSQEQMAEDAVQEAFIVAFTHLDRLHKTQAFGAWLRGIVRYQCYRERRKIPTELSWENMEEAARCDSDPADDADNRMFQEQVRAAISELPLRHREVVRMHYEDGWSQMEIATRLNLTRGAVNMRLHAARARLRRRLITMDEQTFNQKNRGQVLSANGPVITIRFEPESVPPIFSLLLSDNKESFCIIQHSAKGTIRAIAARSETKLAPGQNVMATGQPFTEALELSVIQQGANALRPNLPGSGRALSNPKLESGIKTIEVFAPLAQGGVTGVFSEWGLGVLVLLPELMRHLDHDGNRQVFLVFVPQIRDAEHWKEVVAEITFGSDNIEMVYLPTADPITPQTQDSVSDLDATLVLSRRLAEQAIWPCLDPLLCHSRLQDIVKAKSKLDSVGVSVQHLLRRYYALEFSLGEEASRSLSAQDLQHVQRARKALRFLSQPFFVAEPYTKQPGVYVTSIEALRGFADIVDGRYDSSAKDAFYMVGAAPR